MFTERDRSKKYKYLIFIYFISIIFIGIAGLFYAVKVKNLTAKKISIYINISLYLLMSGYKLATNIYRKYSHYFTFSLTKKESLLLYLPGLWITGFLLFITIPFGLLSTSNILDFEEPFSFFIKYFFTIFLIFILIGLIIYYIIPELWKNIISSFIVISVFLFLMNTFVFTGNYGEMDQFQFLKKLDITSISKILNVISSLVLISALLYLVIKGKIKPLINLMMFISASLLLLFIFDAHNFTKRETLEKNDKYNNIELSKNGKNIIILMHDRFIGSYINEILEYSPELKKQLDGFTWYPKCLSPASTTLGGVPAIMGGYEYAIQNFNSTRTDIPIAEKINESARILPYNFNRIGYNTQICHHASFYKFKNKKFIEDTKMSSLRGKFTDRWFKENNIKNFVSNPINSLLRFSLFRISSPIFRKYIYDKGNWHLTAKIKQNASSGFFYFRQGDAKMRKTLIDRWTVLRYLPEISAIDTQSRGTFIFMHDHTSHEIWGMNSSGEPQTDNGIIKYLYDIYKKLGGGNGNGAKCFYTDTAVLKLLPRWIDWMKKNGIYDNTRIILVSDHGMSKITYPMFNRQTIHGTDNPNWGRGGVFQTLLMVKDFNSHGIIKTDLTPMTVCDVPYLATKNIIKAINPYTGRYIVENNNKYPFYCHYISPDIKKMGKFKYLYKEKYKIKNDDIFNMDNWEIIK